MALNPQLVAQFRAHLKRSRDDDPEAWEVSRKLVAPAFVESTLKRLRDAVEASSLPPALQEALASILAGSGATRIQALSGEALKELTGLPTTKAVRTLCVFFGLAAPLNSTMPASTSTPAEIEELVRRHSSPFDVLLSAGVASVLDIGAGDLSFAAELADQYGPRLQSQEAELILHCLDRLQPGSRLGGGLHADPALIEKLTGPTGTSLAEVQFRFWGNQDMFELERVKGVWPRYTIATCQAPATPTFAYEPRRIAPAIIQRHLRASKGEFQRILIEEEEALEVLHNGRALLFPPWKFDIRGPLALLDLLSRRGKLCVLASIDSEVFWEILSQLLADPRVRPQDLVFDPAIIRDLFGHLHTKLAALPMGGRLVLSDVTDLRPAIPRVLDAPAEDAGSYRFRYVEIRRGAVFTGIPAGRTARLFRTMREEEPPWFMILVPDEKP